MVMVVRALQSRKAYPPIVVTLVGRVMEVRLLHPLKVNHSMLVNPSGIVMAVRL